MGRPMDNGWTVKDAVEIPVRPNSRMKTFRRLL